MIRYTTRPSSSLVSNRRPHSSSAMRHRSHRYHGHHSQSASPSAHADPAGHLRLSRPTGQLQRIRTNATPPPPSDHDSDVDREVDWNRIRNLNIPQQLSIPQNAGSDPDNLYIAHPHRRLYQNIASSMNRAAPQQFSPPAPLALSIENVCTFYILYISKWTCSGMAT